VNVIPRYVFNILFSHMLMTFYTTAIREPLLKSKLSRLQGFSTISTTSAHRLLCPLVNHSNFTFFNHGISLSVSIAIRSLVHAQYFPISPSLAWETHYRALHSCHERQLFPLGHLQSLHIPILVQSIPISYSTKGKDPSMSLRSGTN
jgi:hypothetical protein